jgi:hypothetical protein
MRQINNRKLDMRQINKSIVFFFWILTLPFNRSVEGEWDIKNYPVFVYEESSFIILMLT